MTESPSSEQPRVTQSAAESGGATPQDHTGSRHVSFEIGPLDKEIEKFVGGDHAPSIVPTGPAVGGTTLGEAQECVQEAAFEREQAFSYTLPEVPQRDASKLAAADGSGGATSQGQEQDFLNAALNEREEAHRAFRQWLVAKDLETTHSILGELGIRTVSSLVNLTEKQFEDTLGLFPTKRPGEPADVKDPERYAPAHVAGVRELRDLSRKGTPGAAVVGVQPEQANDQDEAQTPAAAMEAAMKEAEKLLEEAQEMVQELMMLGLMVWK